MKLELCTLLEFFICTYSSISSFVNSHLISSFLTLSCLHARQPFLFLFLHLEALSFLSSRYLSILSWSLNKQPFLFLFLHLEALSFLSPRYLSILVPSNHPFTFPFHKLGANIGSFRYIVHSSSNQELHGKLDLLCPPTHIRKY